MTGGRSVYSETELNQWQATPARPVKVINYLLVAYIEPPIDLSELKRLGIFTNHPPQSIFEINATKLATLLPRLSLGFTP